MTGPIWSPQRFGPDLPLTPAERWRWTVFGILVAIGTVVELITFALVLDQSMRVSAACASLPNADCPDAPSLISLGLSLFGGSAATIIGLSFAARRVRSGRYGLGPAAAGIGSTVAMAGIAVLILHLGLPS